MGLLNKLFGCDSSAEEDLEVILVTEANAAYHASSSVGSVVSAIRQTKEARALRILYLCHHGRLPE
jgi:hypothetical protein